MDRCRAGDRPGGGARRPRSRSRRPGPGDMALGNPTRAGDGDRIRLGRLPALRRVWRNDVFPGIQGQYIDTGQGALRAARDADRRSAPWPPPASCSPAAPGRRSTSRWSTTSSPRQAADRRQGRSDRCSGQIGEHAGLTDDAVRGLPPGPARPSTRFRSASPATTPRRTASTRHADLHRRRQKLDGEQSLAALGAAIAAALAPPGLLSETARVRADRAPCTFQRPQRLRASSPSSSRPSSASSRG